MQLPEWEKTFASHISDEGLTFKIYKEFLQCNHSSEKDDLNFKSGRRFEQAFLQKKRKKKDYCL